MAALPPNHGSILSTETRQPSGFLDPFLQDCTLSNGIGCHSFNYFEEIGRKQIATVLGGTNPNWQISKGLFYFESHMSYAIRPEVEAELL
jgi:hypothetical protein